MSVPEPVLPDYGGANLAGVVPGLLRPGADRPAWFPEPLRMARQVVLLVVDGLGWGQLCDRPGLAPMLSGMAGAPITSVAPSTTATALTSLTVGVPPARHGIVGYRMVVAGPTGSEVLNVLRWRTPSGDARAFARPDDMQPVVPFEGHAVPVVSKTEFAGTAFTEAHQRGARQTGWMLASSLTVEVRRLLRAGEPLVYAYYEGVDKVAHVHGFGEHYDAELVALDRIVADLVEVLPPGAALAVTADHGQVQVGDRAKVLDPRVRDGLALMSGEARFRWLHADGRGGPAAVGRLREVTEDLYGDEAWVLTVDRMEAEGWFGGALAPAVRARLGDVAVVPHEPIAYLDPADSFDPLLVCRHGSLTPDEMWVPLVAHLA